MTPLYPKSREIQVKFFKFFSKVNISLDNGLLKFKTFLLLASSKDRLEACKALHASNLSFEDASNKKVLNFKSPLSKDILTLEKNLKNLT